MHPSATKMPASPGSRSDANEPVSDEDAGIAGIEE